MLTVCSGELPPTKTYARRSWCWLSNGSGFISHDRIDEHGEVVTEHIPGDGKLTIRVDHRERRYFLVRSIRPAGDEPPTFRAGKPLANSSVEVDTYAVMPTDPVAFGVKSYLLLNLSDPSQREPYLVSLGGAVDSCRCRAGMCRVESGCKHFSACEALIEEGIL